MSREITITLDDADMATLQEEVEYANRVLGTDWQTIDNEVAGIVRHWLFEKREHKKFMIELEATVREINARKSQK